jgi:hypothetical protein
MKNFVKVAAVLILASFVIIITISSKIITAERTNYYIDSVTGNDNNNGTSPGSAWQSLDKVNSMVFKPGDSILFKANCTWTGTLQPKGSGDSTKQITIGMYASNQRERREKPHIEGKGAYAAVQLKEAEYWTISNLRVTNLSGTTEIKLRNGILVLAKAVGITHRIIVQDCEVSDVDGDYRRAIGMYKNSGIRISYPGTSTAENRYDEVLIQRNFVHDVRTNGIYVVSERDARYESFYTNVKVANNTIIRTGADGAIISHCISPVVENNQVLDAGYYGNYLTTSWIAGLWQDNNKGTIIFQNNEVARTRAFFGDGQAFDTDWGSGGTSIYQYNYTHQNEGGFYLNCATITPAPDYVKTVLRYNISVNDEQFIIAHDNPTPVEVYNNIFYKVAGSLEPGSCKDFKFWNNIFNFTTEPNWGLSEYSNNCYYPVGKNSADAKGISANPKFVVAGFMADGKRLFNDYYKLLPNSPCIDAGMVIPNNGSKDYWGNPLYNGSPDIGAMEYYKEVKK